MVVYATLPQENGAWQHKSGIQLTYEVEVQMSNNLLHTCVQGPSDFLVKFGKAESGLGLGTVMLQY